jgi:diadenosine tetraphosphate (Ap4A) HIT family hydrolase
MLGMKCLFCDSYRRWKKEGLIIYENPEVFSIFDVLPAVPAQALVVPKTHVEDISLVRSSQLEYYCDAEQGTFEAIQKICGEEALRVNPPAEQSAEFAEMMLRHPALRKKPVAYNVGVNCGYSAGQRIAHLHKHVFPVTENGLGIVSAMREYRSRQKD